MNRRLRAGVYLWLTFAGCLAPVASAQDLRIADANAARIAALAERLVAPHRVATIAILDERQHFTWGEGAVGWELEGRSLFTYDGVFRTEEVAYEWNGSSFEPAFRYEYSADAFNNVTATYAWDASANDYVPVDRTDYEYYYDLFTGEKYVESLVYKVWDGSAYVNDERTVYGFTDDLIYISSQTDRWDGSAWQPAERETVTEEGGKVVFAFQEYQSGAWSNTERVAYNYPTRKALYEELRAVLAASGDYEGFLYLLQLLPASEMQTWDGTAWVNSSRQTIAYDFSTGRKLYVDYEDYTDGDWSASARIALSYSEAGEISTLSFQANDGLGNWETVLQEQYTWNAEGSVSSVWMTMDLGSGLTNSAKTDLVWRYTGVSAEKDELAATFELAPAYPNPFNPTTKLTYRVAESGRQSVRIFDTLGREVATLFDGVRAAGSYDVTFDGAGLPSGTYLVRLETASGQMVRPVSLLK